jgi:hypothetical protein
MLLGRNRLVRETFERCLAASQLHMTQSAIGKNNEKHPQYQLRSGESVRQHT